MKFTIVILAVVAAASAQYSPFQQYNPGQYNPGQYKPFARKPYVAPSTYRPFVSSTPAPIVYAPSTYAPVVPTPIAPLVAKTIYNGDARSANIVKYSNEINPDGSYAYFFETDNGIAAQEQGTPRNLGGNPPVISNVATGSHSWTSPEGQNIVISYVADENGYQPTGNALPQAPPVPEAILRSLEYIARNAPKQL